MKFAAIDIGSNAIRLLVGSVAQANGSIPVKKVSLVRVPIRLGEDVFSTGEVSHHKLRQLIKAIEAFKLLMEVHEVVDYRACATSAMREASNGEKVVQAVEARTGVHIELIEGDIESTLIYKTFLQQTDKEHSKLLYIDVGGGSTEVTLLSDGEPVRTYSFKIGTVRILQGKVTEADWQALRDWVSDFRKEGNGMSALGTGGNINKLLTLSGGKKNKPISLEKLESMAEELKKLNYQERMEVHDLKPDRADVIVPASEIYLTVMREAGVKKMIVPKIGLADGIITDLYARYYS